MQLIEFVGQYPSLREEVVLQGKELLKTLEILGQVRLPCDLIHGWEVIDLLVWLESLQSLAIDAQILPEYIKLSQRILILRNAPVELLFGDLLYERVFGF